MTQTTLYKRCALAAALVASAMALAACGPQEDIEVDESGSAAASPADPATAEAAQAGDVVAEGSDTEARRWNCPADPGQAPSGNLVAERIPNTEPESEAPGLYEGPVWHNGALYFSDFTFEDGFPSQVQRLNPDGSMEVAIEESGSNGHSVDSEGYLMAATHDRKAISRYNLDTGEREIIWDSFEGNPFNSPNDITLTHDGIIYFTDPDFQRDAAPGGQDKTRVYRIDDKGISVVDDTMNNPNGVSLSPDEQTLYVAGGGGSGTLRAYDLSSGEVGESRDLADLSQPDGMAIDCHGNIYATEHGEQRIRVFSPAGDALATIEFDANVTNAAFGGPENKTLMVTGAGTLWKVELDVAGFPY